jgi:3-deoxy-7-phosphoheptulonate synthase
VRVGKAVFGGSDFVMVGGPCSVESPAQIEACADAVASSGGSVLRGGAFKPRTSPYSFQGLGVAGLALMAQAATKRGLAVVTEVMNAKQVEEVSAHADMLQIGARNMQNFDLLRAAGRQRKPVLLKRGMSASLDELLWSAEYLLAEGNDQIVLCERGIRTFETSTRSTLDISAIPVLKARTHLPVIVDPSHAAGDRELVPALTRAAKAVGADGVIVEIHPRPNEALCDGPQALTLGMWRSLVRELGGRR